MNSDETLFSHIVSDLGMQVSKITLPIVNNKDFPDLYLRCSLFGEDSKFKENLTPEIFHDSKKIIYMLNDDFRCNYIGGRLENNDFYIVGPYLLGSIDPMEIRKMLLDHGMQNTDTTYLSKYYHSLPVIRDDNLLYAIVQAHASKRFGKESYEIQTLPLHLEDYVESDSKVKEYSGYQMQKHSEIYAREDLLMEAISKGNYNLAINEFNKLHMHNPEYRSSNTLRDMKNYSVILNTICRIAAKRGGAKPYDIDDYSGRIARNIENSPSIKDLKSQMEGIISGYCNLVKKSQLSDYSYSIRQITDYIDNHYFEEISLTRAAKMFNMSSSYLSTRFHKETGKSFSEYLLEKRLEHAKQLITKTNLSISAIAEDCGIPDNNYFSRVFKKKEGVTPFEYREKHK